MLSEANIASMVLAGGGGTRLGGNKLSHIIGDQTLLERVLSSVAPLSNEILVVIADGQAPPVLAHAIAKIVFDIYPEKGVLGGLYAGLSALSNSHTLAVGCDMPFLNIPLLRSMAQLAPSFDAVVPKVDGKVHPLHAIYNKSCLPVVQEQIESGDLRVTRLLTRLRVRYIMEDEIDKFDPKHLSFFNINTPDDLNRARELAAQLRGNA